MSESIENDDLIEEAEKPNGAGRAISGDDVEDLKRQLARERAERTAEAQRRERAESERDEARGAVQNESGRRWQAEEQALDTSLSSLASEMDALEDRYATLIEAGQFKDAAKVQRRMAEAQADARLIQEKKTWLADAKKIEEQNQQRRPAPTSGDGIDLSAYSPKQRQWIREEHPEYLTDARFRAKVAAAHHDALAEDIAIDSDDYFEHINSFIGAKPAARQQATEQQEEPQQPRRRAAPEVPVQRRSSPQAAARQEALRISEDEKEAADITLPHLPVEDQVDAKGVVTQYGRYRQYKINQKTMRDQGRLN